MPWNATTFIIIHPFDQFHDFDDSGAFINVVCARTGRFYHLGQFRGVVHARTGDQDGSTLIKVSGHYLISLMR